MNDKTENIKEIIRYLIVGVMTTAVSIGSYFFFTETFLNPDNPLQLQIANILSWIASVTFAYFASRKYVFHSSNKKLITEMTLFYLARITTLGIDVLIMLIGVTLLNGNDKVVKLLAQLIIIICNYVFSKVFVFKRKGHDDSSTSDLSEN